jgi:N-formylmaleamate deformylase
MDEFQRDYVESNGIRIHYYRSTPPDARMTVVLLHGITDNGMCWVRVARALKDRYDVIMPDTRGHGFSGAPESGYSQKDRANDLAGLIQGLGLDRPVLFGHSLGADTATITAAHYPDLVRGVILEDPPWREGAWGNTHQDRQQIAAGWRADLEKRKTQSTQELLAEARENHPNWHEDEYGPWAESKLQMSLNILDGFRTDRQKWQELLAQIRCPVLLITADPQLGGIITPQTAQEAAGIWQQGRVVNIPATGHSIHRDNFAAVMSEVDSFLMEV